MKALRLFQITDLSAKKPVEGLFFSDKIRAKKARSEMNEGSKELRFVVSPGPDHHKYKEVA